MDANKQIAELRSALEPLLEAARCMADPEHCMHHCREHLPWAAMRDKAHAALDRAIPGSPGHPSSPAATSAGARNGEPQSSEDAR